MTVFLDYSFQVRDIHHESRPHERRIGMLTSDESLIGGASMVTGINGCIMYYQSGINHHAVESVAENTCTPSKVTQSCQWL